MDQPLRRVWFVTRKYPPSVGGMERLAKQIVTALQRRQPPVVIAWSRSQRWLPLFLLVAAMRILWGRMRGRIAVLYLGDPVLACLAALVRGTGVPVIVTVHGLDILYPSRIYQAYLRWFFWGRFNAYVAISQHVSELLHAHGVDGSLIEVLPLGIDVQEVEVPITEPGASPMLLSLGRLVPRKGQAWFVEHVAPRLFMHHPDAKLVIAGTGPERANIAAAAERAGVASHVEFRGSVDEATKRDLLARSDAVIMPNIVVPGDTEGFGLVALEAGAAGKVVFAADLEGLRDAVKQGENGWLLSSADAGAWIDALQRALDDRAGLRLAGQRARQCVQARYSWADVGERYARVVERFTAG